MHSELKLIFFIISTILNCVLGRAENGEAVFVRGAIGSSVECGETSCALSCPAVYTVTSCVSRANVTCPLQTIQANDPYPTYTHEIFYGPTVTFNFYHMRWAVWLVVNDTTATLSMMKQIRSDTDNEWCIPGVVYEDYPKGCYWQNYTIQSCWNTSDFSDDILEPIASVKVIPDDMNTFPSIDVFDVFYQAGCQKRCGVAGLGCCDNDEDISIVTCYDYIINSHVLEVALVLGCGLTVFSCVSIFLLVVLKKLFVKRNTGFVKLVAET